MASVLDRIAKLVVSRRRVMLAVVAAIALASGWQALKVEADFTPEDLFAQDGQQKDATESFRESFGNTDNVLVVLVEAQDVLAPDVLRYLRDLSDYLARQPYAAHVSSITREPLPARSGTARPLGTAITGSALWADIAGGRLQVDAAIGDRPVDADAAAELARRLEQTPAVWGQLLARDRSVAVVAMLLTRDQDRVDELRAVVSQVEDYLDNRIPEATQAPKNLRTHLGGLPYIRVDVVRSVEADQRVLFPAAFAVIFVLLLLTFRWPPAIVLGFVVVGLSACVLMGAMGAAGEKLNIINNVVPILVIIIGISDSIHLINRYGEELNRGLDRGAAATGATRAMVVALFLTSFTTAVGFASLMVSELPILGRFGLTAAVGVLVAYLMTIAILPAALSILPPPPKSFADPRRGWLERRVGALFEAVAARRWAVLAGSTCLLASTSFLACGVTVDTAVHHQFEPGNGAWRGMQLLEHELDGLRPVEVALSGPPGSFQDRDTIVSLDRVTQWVRGQPAVLSTHSYSDLLRQAWFVATGNAEAHRAPMPETATLGILAQLLDRAPTQLQRFVTPDRARARMNVRMADVGGVAILQFVDKLRARLARELGDEIEVAITGEGFTSSEGLTTLTRDMLMSLFLAILVIFGFMTLVLRSVRLGLISVPPNVLPLVATIAYLRVRGIPLSLGTVIIFSVSIGLAVDGTIHVLARFREELRAGATKDQALARAGRGTGKAVVVSYVSLMIGFTVFQLSTFVPVQQFGELVSITIAGCLLSTLVVLPALLSAAWPADPGAGRDKVSADR